MGGMSALRSINRPGTPLKMAAGLLIRVNAVEAESWST
jgi:hypothetical protein